MSLRMRSPDDRCGNCWGFTLLDKKSGAGKCRKHPAQVVPAEMQAYPVKTLIPNGPSHVIRVTASGFEFPSMHESGWCDEHDRRPTEGGAN